MRVEREIANVVFNIIFNDAGGRGPTGLKMLSVK